MRPSLPAFAAGLAAGLKVTSDLHSSPDAGKWGDRLGSTRLRYALLDEVVKRKLDPASAAAKLLDRR